jgi:Ca-activated chloride channel family protein
MRKLSSITALVLSFSASASTAHAAGLLSTSAGLLAPSDTKVVAVADEQVLTVTEEITFAPATAGAARLLLPVGEGASVVGVEIFRNGLWEAAKVTGDDATEATDGGPGRVPMNGEATTWLGDDGFSLDLPDLGEKVAVRITTLGIAGYDQGKIRLRLPLRAGPAQVGHEGPTSVSLRVISDRPFAGYEGLGGKEQAIAKSQEGARFVLGASYVGPFADDLRFSYGVQESPALWTKLITHHERCDDTSDGFFLLLVRPPLDAAAAEVQPRAFQFVMDRSGSMQGEKLTQAKAAATIGVNLLGDADSFDVVAFDTSVTSAFSSLVPANAGNRALGNAFIDRQLVDGSTNISGALVTAVGKSAESDHARLVVFLTDGQPTAGITTPSAIVQAVTQANASAARIYAFGVGADVNKPLLKNLATATGGEARFLAGNADLSREIGDFLSSVSAPVLVDASVSFGAVGVSDAYPHQPVDVFAGRQIIVVGRYHTGGETTASLVGTAGGQPQTTSFGASFPTCSAGAAPFLPRLWAKTKIDSLLAQLAATGGDDPTLIAQIEELSQQYGVQSPYASYGVGQAPPAGDPNASNGVNAGTGNYPSSYSSGGLDDEPPFVLAGAFGLGAMAFVAALGLGARRRRAEAITFG